VTYRGRSSSDEGGTSNLTGNLQMGCLAGGVVGLVILGLVIFLNPFAVIDEGHVGLVTEFGRAKEVRTTGITMINPFTQDIKEVEVRTRPIKFEKIEAASAEQQSVLLTGTLNYSVDASPEKIIHLYRTVGLDYQGRVLNAALNDETKAALPHYTVNTILTSRHAISDGVVKAMNSRLAEHGIVVHDLFLENIAFSPEFQKAIEEKQVAAQTAEKEQQVTIQQREKANQTIAQAEGQAAANALLTKDLSPAVLQSKAIEKWDGKLPQYMGGDSVPFIQVGGS
jgi:regulator of protease activity HflC (stomatin/prohibitin superfamily)